MSGTYTNKRTGDKVKITDTHFKSKGGEGSIYIIGDTVYKICLDGKMIPEQKLLELAALDHPHIVVPKDILQKRKKDVGYTMMAVPGSPFPLGQILTKPFREREGVSPDHMMKLAEQIGGKGGIIRYVHSKPGYLLIDGNEFNFMVTDDFEEVYAIDTNSYKTPSFPAEVIMPNIRDWQVTRQADGSFNFSELSDWYSWAIISWYMFTGIHPYKGWHPENTTMKKMMVENMQNGRSVLDPKADFPLGTVYHPFDEYIPGGKDGAYMQWYRAVLLENKRLPAPEHWQAVLTFIARVKEIIGSDKFDMQELRSFADQIVAFYQCRGREVVVTRNNLFVQGTQKDRPADKFRVGFTPKNNVPYAAWLDDGNVRLQNLDTGHPIDITLAGTNIMSCEGRVYVQGQSNILELTFVESGGLIGASRTVASIMPHATQLFQGVAIQDMFGAYIASIFPEAGHHRQVRLDGLGNHRITECKYEGNVLMVVAANKESGEYDRFVFRLTSDWEPQLLVKAENIVPSGINFTVLDKGICACIDEEENVQVFSAKAGRPDIKQVKDPAIQSDMRLCHVGDQMRFARSNKLYSISFK